MLGTSQEHLESLDHQPPNSEAMPALVDAQVLLAACGGDPDILAHIVIAFRGHLPTELQRAADGLRAADAAALREAAHRVYGMISAISSRAGVVASDLEDQAALGRLDEAGPLLTRLSGMADELLAVIGALSVDELRARLGSGA